ncbi:hypothetical protein L9F63_015259, partial [Diploptera punctata]
YLTLWSSHDKSKRHTCLLGYISFLTGATSGIGKEIAAGILIRGAKVCLACRDVKKGEQVKEEIIAATELPESRIAVYHLDLSSLDSVRKFVKEVCTKEETIDILVNNAGATGLGNKITEDGILIGMQVNYFAPFLLTCLLLEKLKKSAPSRIVWVTSKLYNFAKLDIDDLNFEKSFNETQVYLSSKLAIILVAKELAKRMNSTGVTINTVHPGFTSTQMWHYLPSIVLLIWNFTLKKFFKTTFEAAQTAIYAAVDPFLVTVTGKHFAECQEELLTSKVLDQIMAMKLYNKSLDTVKLTPSFMQEQFSALKHKYETP